MTMQILNGSTGKANSIENNMFAIRVGILKGAIAKNVHIKKH